MPTLSQCLPLYFHTGKLKYFKDKAYLMDFSSALHQKSRSKVGLFQGFSDLEKDIIIISKQSFL